MPLIDSTGRPMTAAASQSSSADANLGASAPAGSSPHIKDTDIANFAADVLNASRDVPVIVDFWAPWCGPCKQLGPMLERLVEQAKGAVKLVKVNIDENPEIAQQLRVQSIPTVYAFKNGQPVDGFMGAVPEAQLRTFIQTLIGGDAGASAADDAMAAAAEALEAGDVGMAAQVYGAVLQEDPGNPKAVAGLAKCYLHSGDLERARTTLGLVRPDSANDEAIRAVEAELQLKESGAQAATDTAPLQAQLTANPADHQARYDLALALDANGDREGAMDQLLELFRRDRKWNDDAARKQLVTLFDAMGPTDPRTIAGRRRLSSLLFS